MKYIPFLLAVILASGHLCAQSVLLTFDQRWHNLGLVAIVDVGPVTEVSTPQRLVLQSATAKIIKLVYRRFPPLEDTPKDEIILYSFMPNGFDVACPGYPTLKSGMAFVMVKQNGINKFFPSDPWEFQSLNSDKILWPVGLKVEERPLNEVLSEIKSDITKHKNNER